MNNEQVLKVDLIAELIKENQELKEQLSHHQHFDDQLRPIPLNKSFALSTAIMSLYGAEDGKLIEVNDAWLKTYGFTREEVIGRTRMDLKVGDIAGKNLTPQGYHEIRIKNNRGEDLILLNTLENININGRICSLSTSIDITKRRQMEDAVRQSEEKFAAVFRSSPIIMAIESQIDRKCIDVNDAWLQAFGYSRDHVVGHTYIEFGLFTEHNDLSPEDLPTANDKSNYPYEISYKGSDGEMHIGLASSESIYLDGSPCYLHSIIDVTEQKRIEKEIGRLERLNLIGEMAASIGHEIRNPMTAVRGFIQLLKEQPGYKKDQIYFELMIEELDRANEKISEYLGMAKDKNVDFQPQYLDQIVKAISPLLEADANHKGMNLKLELRKPPLLIFDKNEIRQLILNMARNGLEAMHSGGTLTIGTKEIKNEVVLYIKDEGQGLPAEVLDKLGTPFITTKDKGTGLGLAVCYSIATRHNARIDFDTNSHGTTFFVYFPIPQERLEVG